MIDADVVVWFPNDFAAPRDEVCQWFDDWLAEYPNRTLVFVGRDYSAAPEYFRFLVEHQSRQKLQGASPSDGQKSIRKGLPDLPDVETPKKDSDKDSSNCEWFHYEERPHAEVGILAGIWSQGIDASKSNLELRTRMVPDKSIQTLLSADDDFIVGRLSKPYWDESQVLLVTNGSFLVNLPLVNHEHRKLAGKLLDAVGDPVEVVFLESGPGGPPIDPPYTDSSLWTLFRAWPLGTILLQLAAVGIIYCFARWPIFGRPKQLPPESTSDFAKHVAAVGQLLARTKELPPAIGGNWIATVSEATEAPSLTNDLQTLDTRTRIARRPPALPPDSRGN